MGRVLEAIPMLGLVALLGLITWQVKTDGALVRLDGGVNARLRAVRSRATLAAGAWISQVGTGAAGAMVCLLTSAALWSDGRAAWIAPVWVTLIGAQITTWSLKFTTDRRRPAFLDGITAGSPSFPSAHATVSMVTYGIAAHALSAGFAPGRAVFLAVAAVLIGLISFSRLLLSLHYLTDVVAGAAVGLFWVLVGLRMTVGG